MLSFFRVIINNAKSPYKALAKSSEETYTVYVHASVGSSLDPDFFAGPRVCATFQLCAVKYSTGANTMLRHRRRNLSPSSNAGQLL
jgi:hypothetical protein